jgi:hypothetical protein
MRSRGEFPMFIAECLNVLNVECLELPMMRETCE